MGGRGRMGEGGRLGLTWSRRTTGDSSNVIRFTRGAQTRGFRPQGQVGVSVKS